MAGTDGFVALYRQHRRPVLAYIRLRVDGADLAEDLAEEVFVIALRRTREGADVGLSWLLTTARNVIGNEYQRRDRDRERVAALAELAAAGGGAAGDPAAALGSDAALVRAAIADLPPEDQLVVRLTYWDGLSAAEVGRVMELSITAVWSRLSRARAALRAALDDGSDVGPAARRGGELDTAPGGAR